MEPTIVYAIMGFIFVSDLSVAYFFHKRKKSLEIKLASAEMRAEGATPERNALEKQLAAFNIIIPYAMFGAFLLPALVYVMFLSPLAAMY